MSYESGGCPPPQVDGCSIYQAEVRAEAARREELVVLLDEHDPSPGDTGHGPTSATGGN